MTQRESILRALHDDVDKLVVEYGGPQSSESLELLDALRQCDELYRQLTAQLSEQGLTSLARSLSLSVSLSLCLWVSLKMLYE